MATAANLHRDAQAPAVAEPPLPQDGGFEARLEAARTRQRWRLVIEAMLWAATGVAIALLVARLLGAPPTARGWPWLLGGVFAAAGLAVAVARTPTLPQTAREVDARLRLQERTASALEVRRHWQRDHGPVAHALLQDAAAASRDHPPLRAAARSVAVGRRGVGGGGGRTAGSQRDRGARRPAAGGVAADAPPAVPGGAVVEDVRLMAELVATAARRMDEDTLYAVERELDQLAEDAGRGISQAELDRRLAEITQNAVVGFANDLPSWLPRRMDDLGELRDAMTAYKAELEAARLANEALAAHNVEVFRKVWEEQQETEALAEAARLADGAELGGEDDLLEGTMPPNLGAPGMPPGDPAAGAEVGATGATPAGPSPESESGGDAAGLGSQALKAGEAFVELQAEPLAEMALPLADIDRGRRIQVLAVPEADPGAPGGSSAGLGAGPRAAAMAFRRDAVSPAERKVVARYFARTEAQLAAEP